MKTLIEAIAKQTTVNKSKEAARLQRICDALESANDVAPTVDRIGRLHAPVDGYVSSDSDITYAKGEFIPTPEFEGDDFYMPAASSKKPEARRLVSGSVFTQVLEYSETDGVTIGTGKQFNRQGVNSCYAYIKASTKSHLKAVTGWIDDAMKAETEKLEKSKPAKGEAPTGRQSVKGTVLAVKANETDYGITLKMFVELENHATVYGTLPASICDSEAGDKIEFTATFEHASDDNTHAFYKRPSKAKVINEQ